MTKWSPAGPQHSAPQRER